MTAAAAFARFAADLDWRTLPEAIRARLLDHLLDVLAVACAGAAEESAGRLRAAHARASGGGGVCTVLAGATSERLPPVDAAFVNGFAGRIHTFDDTLDSGPIHPGSAVFAAALAAAEYRGAALAEALLGALAGYELAVRLAEAVGPGHYDAGFHGTGTLNAPAAAVAAARALGLDAAATEHAINLAAAAASGTRQHQIDGSMIHSALNGARAAASGVQAALHAAAGIPGAAGQLDGSWGLLGLLRGTAEPAAPIATEGLGSDFALLRVAPKPYPTCRFTHGPIALLGEIAAGLDPAQVAAVEVATFAQSASVSDRPRWADRAEAILSHHFAVAATLLHGAPQASALDALATDPAVQALAARVSVVRDPAFETRAPETLPHRLRLTLRDGRRIEGLSTTPPGGPGVPVSAATLRAKARDLVETTLGQGRLAPVLTLLATPERTSVSALLGALQRAPSREAAA